MDQLHLFALNLKMAVARASEMLTTQPTAKDEKPPNRNNINCGSLLKLIIRGRGSSTDNF